MSPTKNFWLLILIFLKWSYGKVSYDEYKQFYNKQVISELDKYELGKYSFKNGTILKIYKPDETLKQFNSKGTADLVCLVEGQDGCLSLTTAISETIVLECPEAQPNEPGCFYIFSPSDVSENGRPSDERKVEKSCVEVLNEHCVGIVTPSNWTLPLDCGAENTTVVVSDILKKFQRGNYSFEVGQNINAYNTEESKDKVYSVYRIDEYGKCLGLTTDAFETVVLQCPGKKPEKPGCFEVFSPRTKPQNNTVVAVREIKKACVRTIGAFCVGIFTPLTWMILLECLPSSTIVPQYGINVPNNGPPPRM